MKIAYFGGDMFFPCMEYILKSGHEIISLFTNKQDPKKFNEVQHVCRQAQVLNIPINFSKPTIDDLKELYALECDIIISAGYGYKIPRWENTGIKYAINIHPSLLPIGAGPAPLPYIIMKGFKSSGVTIHQISQEWDAGDIILQKSFPLLGDENLEHLFCESKKLAVTLINQFLESPDDLWRKAHPQHNNVREYWPMPEAQEFRANFAESLEIIDRSLRVHRFVDVEGNIEYISNVSCWKQEHDLLPGEIISQENGVHLVSSREGMVCFKLNKISPYQYRLFPSKGT